MPPPLIALEEHYTSEHIRRNQKGPDVYATFPPALTAKLSDLGEMRLKDMDAGHLALQIVSHGPSEGTPENCAKANDDLAAGVAKHPDRLKAFAMLAMTDPDSAVQELERCVKQHGFLGALINNCLRTGTFYDDRRFWPVFEKAVELDVPVYIHPTFASDDIAQHYAGNFNAPALIGMGQSAWGWHSETALHFLRLWASGFFDAVPKAKIIIGHMGEMLPFQLDRIAYMTHTWADKEGVKPKRDILTVWRENIWVTTSGMFSMAPMGCLLKMSPVEKIMYSVDYPFAPNERGVPFVEKLEKSGLVSQEEFEAICHGNAEKLLKVKAKA